MQPWMFWKLICCRPGWPQTQRPLPPEFWDYKTKNKKLDQKIFKIMCVFVCVPRWGICACVREDACKGPEESNGSPEMELQVIGGYKLPNLGARNWAWVFYESTTSF